MMGVRFGLYVCFMGYFAAGSGDFPICSSKQQATANVGETVLLSCHFLVGESTNNLTVIWTKATEAAKDILGQKQSESETVNNQSAAYPAMYEARLQSNTASLTFARIRAEDAGEYRCLVLRSPPSFTDTYRCCAISLHVDQQWKGNEVQVVVAWSVYAIFLLLCLVLLHSCRQQKTPPDKLYDV